MSPAQRMGLWALVIVSLTSARALPWPQDDRARVPQIFPPCLNVIEWHGPSGPEVHCGTDVPFDLIPGLIEGDAVADGLRLPGAMSETTRLALGLPININSAQASTLALMPGISPAVAERIVQYRTQHGPFACLKNLREVRGVGPATQQRLQHKLFVGPATLAKDPSDLL